jgi:NAD(P)-dependent dehydrogenase (short-subunit alcohol dehydrogenase family)
VWKPAVEHGLTEWWQEVQNNLVSAFLMCREVFPVMKQQGGGAVINFSRAGLPQANMLAYNCAKSGVDALTRTFALEGREANIRVNAVAPGLTDTKANLTSMQPKDTTKWTAREDIAAAVLFLASPQAHGITGQVIAVAGKGI